MNLEKTTRREVIAAGIALAGSALGASAATENRQEKKTMSITCYQVGDQKGIASLVRTECDISAPGPGQVQIATRAAALNHRDLMVAEGRYGGPKPATRVPLGDGAGVITAVGDGVTGFAVGDRVTAPHFTLWRDGDYDPAIFAADLGNSADGWLAERVTLPANSLVSLPDSVEFGEAAALGAAGITAWAVLETLGEIKAGDTVLALGTGGVSIMALHIAVMNGARVAITSSSSEKLALARDLGADITVNYREQADWENAVLEATGGRGVDIVVETVGPATLEQSIACCAPNGRIGFLGALGTPPDTLNLFPMLTKNIVLKGITSGTRRMLDDLLRACDANGMKPHIDRRFAYDDAVAAYEYLQQGGHVGKVVIEFPA